ncbi:glycoside hydrolase family 6 protein [Rugosimonospora africana]|uniref:Glucanase n=1 Tax=Rugosimonospora africana TaxID=556532 RepID=A0A8J3VQK9_9ACTN|nr:glycoside hydrolase family 6 protein [Rugosimonospora africana]GIH14591.1 glucanase [Rugosimonospora africana]
MRFVPLRAAGRSRLRRATIVASALVLGSGMAVVAATQASAATGCSVNYQVTNQWPGGFGASIAITNLGDPISSWTLKWTWPSGQTVQSGWSGNFSQSGSTETVTSLSYNGNIATGATVSGIGFNGSWTGSNTNPTSFTLNGVTCNGSVGSSPTPTRTTASPTPTRTTASPTPTRTTTSPTPTSTGSPCTTNCPAHVDNPYAGAKGYVNPEWQAEANAESGGSRVSNNPTGVWLDRIAAIAGANGAMGLRAHLDQALAERSGSTPEYIQFVIYDLPGRDCAALASNGELGPNDIGRYESEYIDPIAAIMSDSKYSSLRIINIIEIDSLPNLVTNTNGTAGATDMCNTMLQNGNYVKGIQYALNKLHAISNAYNYIDAGHHAWLGWDSNFGPAADLFASTARGTTAGMASVDGFITDTANYSALQEPYFNINSTVGGQSVRQSTWVDWNNYVDELSFAQAFRTKLVSEGFSSGLGMLIDTSRDGWGGPNRPTAASTSTDMNTFVNQSRIDKRIHAGNWCNQSGAGLGERPRANPGPAGIDAYVWIKPPGESDGSSSAISNDEGKGFDRMCDPTYGGNARNGNNMSGALPNAPLSGHWFSAQFQQLMANAYPPLS